MWNPEKIEIRNLFSHRESVYDFKTNSCTVIFGSNQTDRNLENNGAGKTTLFEAICIALTNESLRAIKKDSFINRDEEDCRIVFHLYNPVLKMKLRISRQFFRGNKSAKIEIYENGVLNKQVTSVNEANKRVIELIGISRDDLLRYYIISQDNRYTFFTASDGDKKEIMNRITSADMINPISEELQKRYKEKSAEYKIINDEIDKYNSKKEIIEEQRQEVIRNDNSDEELSEIKDKIVEIQESIEESNSKKKKNVSKVKELESLKSGIEVPDVSLLKKKRKKLSEEIEELEKEILENKKMKKNISSELEDKISCPKCKHEFILDSELNLTPETAQEFIEELEEHAAESAEKVEKKEKQLSEINKKIKQSDKISEELDDIEDKISQCNRLIKKFTGETEDLSLRINKLNERVKELKKKKKDDVLLNSLNLKLKECDVEIDNLTKKLLPLSDEIELIKFWQFNMGRSGFQTYLANKSIKIIEGITNSFLKKFGVDISILINGFTILKDGSVREKIDVFVLNDGVTAEQFLSKSGGERGRVTLAGVLGIQHLINLSLNGKGLNLLVFDECFHGMDSRGQENIIKIFEKLDVTILVITQNVSETFNNENKLLVVKKNEISEYIQQS